MPREEIIKLKPLRDAEEKNIERFANATFRGRTEHNNEVRKLWTWLADPDSDIANMSNRAIRHFIDKRFGASVGDLPQSLQGLIEETRQSYGDLELVCPLVRVVAIEGF